VRFNVRDAFEGGGAAAIDWSIVRTSISCPVGCLCALSCSATNNVHAVSTVVIRCYPQSVTRAGGHIDTPVFAGIVFTCSEHCAARLLIGASCLNFHV
jgi:hypothetical protein